MDRHHCCGLAAFLSGWSKWPAAYFFFPWTLKGSIEMGFKEYCVGIKSQNSGCIRILCGHIFLFLDVMITQLFGSICQKKRYMIWLQHRKRKIDMSLLFYLAFHQIMWYSYVMHRYVLNFLSICGSLRVTLQQPSSVLFISYYSLVSSFTLCNMNA